MTLEPDNPPPAEPTPSAPVQTAYDLLVGGQAPSAEFLARARAYDEQPPLDEHDLQQLALEARGLPRLPPMPADPGDADTP